MLFLSQFLALALTWSAVLGFSSQQLSSSSSSSSFRSLHLSSKSEESERHVLSHSLQSDKQHSTKQHIISPRRSFLTTAASIVATTTGSVLGTAQQARAEGEESFADIAARASQIAKDLEKEDAVTAAIVRKTDKTVYNFDLPVQGTPTPFQELIRQEFNDDGVPKVKAVIVVNIKQDDPIARKIIPELISLATRYGRSSPDLAVVACPTDQGYYEPDTSQLVRLKLASEYGYGINPATVITDKVNLLGSGAHPFWRYIQSTCRNPMGLGRIEGNFEKFLIDGRTGLPVRRYPRKYSPLNMSDDIEAVIAGRPLPPARANYLEEWRAAAIESERDTYRFEKGLNYFDQ